MESEAMMAGVNPIQLQKFLKGMDYPASREDIVKHARSHGANKQVLQTLQRLERGNYQTPADISEEVGKFE